MSGLVQGLTAGAGGILRAAVVLVAFLIAAKLVLVCWHRSQEKRMDRAIQRLDDKELGLDELFDEDTERGKIDTIHITRKIPQLVPKLISCVFGGTVFELDGEISRGLLEQLRVSEKKQERLDGVKVSQVELLEIETDVAKTVEEYCTRDMDFISVLITFESNVSMQSAGVGLRVVNYNTSKKHTAKMMFSRNRQRSVEVLRCPKCDAPIMGDTCITCGYRALESDVGFALTFFSIVK